MGEEWLIRLLILLLGLLGGVGSAHTFIVRKVNRNERDIAVNETRLINVEHQVRANAEMGQKQLELMTRIVDQNNLMIQKIIAARE